MGHRLLFDAVDILLEQFLVGWCFDLFADVFDGAGEKSASTSTRI
jgi:hypothetical protein